MTATDKLETSVDLEKKTDTAESDATHTDSPATEPAASEPGTSQPENTELEGTEQPSDRKTVSLRIGRKSAIVSGVLALLLIGSIALATVLYFVDYRPDQQVGAAVQAEVLSAASDGAAAVLTYSPDTLDADFANAESRLSGDFLTYYSGFTEQVVAPAARDNAVKTEATVMGSSIVDLTSSTATVLVFINQSTTSKDTPDPNMTSSSVRLGMEKNDGKWLISSFDPV